MWLPIVVFTFILEQPKHYRFYRENRQWRCCHRETKSYSKTPCTYTCHRRICHPRGTRAIPSKYFILLGAWVQNISTLVCVYAWIVGFSQRSWLVPTDVMSVSQSKGLLELLFSRLSCIIEIRKFYPQILWAILENWDPWI